MCLLPRGTRHGPQRQSRWSSATVQPQLRSEGFLQASGAVAAVSSSMLPGRSCRHLPCLWHWDPLHKRWGAPRSRTDPFSQPRAGGCWAAERWQEGAVSGMEQVKTASTTAAKNYQLGVRVSISSPVKKAAASQKHIPCLSRFCLSLCPAKISEHPGSPPGTPSAGL